MDLIKSLCGMVEGELTSADLASSLGAITDAGICLYNVHQTDDVTVRFSVQRIQYRQLKEIAAKRGDILRPFGQLGIYWKMKRMLNRPVLLVGIFLMLILVFYLPSRVLFIQVEGNSSVPSRRILEAAEASDIVFGTSRREVRSERVKNALLHAVPELQWAGVNTYGCVAVISVRERSEIPQEEDRKGVCHIVALRDGVITSCTATAGNLVCRTGQAVSEGEILISGYTDCGIAIRATRASGEVYGQTVRSLRAISPCDYLRKTNFGEKKRCISLIVRKKRINLWKDSGIWDATCDRIYEEYYVTLPGGFVLPFALAVEEYTVCDTESSWLQSGDREERLSEFASTYIREQTVAGRIDEQNVTFTQGEGFLCLEGKYICTEMIGKVQWEQIGEHNG